MQNKVVDLERNIDMKEQIIEFIQIQLIKHDEQLVDATCDTSDLPQNVDTICDPSDLLQMVDITCDTSDLLQKIDVVCDINNLVQMGKR